MGSRTGSCKALKISPNRKEAWVHVRARKSQAGFSWIELAVLASLVAVFVGSLLTTLLYYEELAESAVVQMTVQNIRSGLRYQIADRLVQGRSTELKQLLSENPVTWLDDPPGGYVGNVRTSDVGGLQAGSWFYDVDRSEVGYVPRRSMYLSVEASDVVVLRWKAQAHRVELSGEAEGFMLISLIPYQWF